jgi:hypothetical protein
LEGIFILLGVVFVGFVFLSIYLADKKRDRFRKFAQERGYQYREEIVGSGGFFDGVIGRAEALQYFLNPYLDCEPLTTGSDLVRHIFESRSGEVAIQCFEYEYKRGSGDDETTYTFSVAGLQIPANLGVMHVRQSGLFDAIGAVFGMQDIKLELEDFNRRFRVMGSSERLVSDILHPQMMEWLLQVDMDSIQIRGDRLVVFRSGGIDEGFVLEASEFLTKFWAKVPDFVKDDHRVRSHV